MYGFSLWLQWLSFLSHLEALFNSAFVSAMTGAGLGAWGAYLIAKNSVRRKEHLDSYRKSNNAVVVVGTIANLAINLKTQLVTPLVSGFRHDQQVAESARASAITTRKSCEIHITADMQKITPLTLPIDAMKNFIYSMDISPGFAIALTAMVEQSAADLNQTLTARSLLIDKFHGLDKNSEDFSFSYLGFVREDGNVDSLYADSMDAIEKYTDDLVFFSAKLAEELTSHSKMIISKYPGLIHKSQKPNSVEFSELRKLKIVPEDHEYKSWLSSFKKRESAAV